jgi:hypothetical protein
MGQAGEQQVGRNVGGPVQPDLVGSPENQKVISNLWYVLVGTLAAIVVISASALVVSLFVKANGTTASQVILTIFTTSLAGLVALFAPTPTQAGRGG